MRRLLFFIICFLLVLVLLPGVFAFELEEFDELVEPEKLELFQKFDRLNILPPSFQLQHIDELISKDDCISLVVSIANWGEGLWIDRTPSFFSRTALKIKRFFSRINLNFSLSKELSIRDNENLLKSSGRWGIKLKPSELDNVVLGWEMLDYECEVLSKMLHKASIPRTLKDELDSIMDEIKSLEVEYEKLEVGGLTEDGNVFGIDEYEKEVWGFYLLALQHNLLTGSMVSDSNFFDRQDPQVALNVELSMFEALLYGEKMIDYVDSLSGYATGYFQKTENIEKSAVLVSRNISMLY